MTTGSSSDNKARHLSIAARTNLWLYLKAFFSNCSFMYLFFIGCCVHQKGVG